ncbi:MAG: nucleotide-diphospho-sugar transferase [Candidatus Omnitrophota bacterium]
MFNTPILFLIFNRPDLTLQVFERIAAIQPTRLYIAADGPRPNYANDNILCSQCREIIDKINWKCDVKTLFRPTNLGCKKAVSEAITWFFQHEEDGIILEDDCLPDESFFLFCQEMLNRYRMDERIMHISGDNFQNGEKRGEGDYYFSLYNHIWGWATWRRAWQLCINEAIDFNDINRFIKENIQTNWGKNYWYDILYKVRNNRIDTWDYYWTFRIWANKGISILPNKNLIKNIGFNAMGTHIKERPANITQTLESMPPSYHDPIKIHVDRDADLVTERVFFQRRPLILRATKKLLTFFGHKK